jgi:hypothetical protein
VRSAQVCRGNAVRGRLLSPSESAPPGSVDYLTHSYAPTCVLATITTYTGCEISNVLRDLLNGETRLANATIDRSMVIASHGTEYIRHYHSKASTPHMLSKGTPSGSFTRCGATKTSSVLFSLLYDMRVTQRSGSWTPTF